MHVSLRKSGKPKSVLSMSAKAFRGDHPDRLRIRRAVIPAIPPRALVEGSGTAKLIRLPPELGTMPKT
jgi:hypothetical protein